MSTNNQVTKSIIVNGDVSHLYNTWVDFRNHPQFLENVTAVTQTDEETFHWVMEGPLNKKFEWTTKITTREPNKRVAWKTVEGDLKKSGQVTFTSLPKGQVEVTITSQTIPPDNLVDKAALFFTDEEAQLEKDLRNFKAHIEARERTV